MEHQFGGPWTEEKLNRLRKYLPAYLKIMRGNPTARQYFRTLYVDAFAGTGYRHTKARVNDAEISLFEESHWDEALGSHENQNFLEGSAKIALDLEPAFDDYLFVDAKLSHTRLLETLKLQYVNAPMEIDIRHGDANAELQALCERTDWRQTRGVVFLDPYGMAVDWATIEALGKRAKIDLWLLFPIGQAVNRVLTKREPPPAHWSAKLDRFFGTHDWHEAFYAAPPSVQQSLFDGLTEIAPVKTANFDAIGAFFVQRLQTVFAHVATPMPLFSSQNIPLYLLCFASQNATALRIASDLLKSDKD